MLTAQGQEGRFSSVSKTAVLSFVSLICVAFLLYVSISTLVATGVRFEPRSLLVIGIISGVVLVAIVAALGFLQAARNTRSQEVSAVNEVSRLKKRLNAVESILQAEPQILIFWESSGEAHVKLNTLEGAHGIPRDAASVLRFRNWLEPKAASELEIKLNGLFQSGAPFSVMIKTLAGSHVEAVGLSSGGRLILKFRDLAGQRLELAKICDQHRKLGQVISAMRGLLDSLPMPVWFRDDERNIEWVNTAYMRSVEASSLGQVVEKQIELLESRQRKKVETALQQGETFHERLHTIIAGDRCTYDTIVLPLGQASAGIAIDVAALETAKGELDQHIAAHTRTLDRVSMAIAIFGPDQRLSFFNEAYLKLWDLDAPWLDTGPKDGEILDRLRELRRLPEQADYRVWKERQLACYQTRDGREDWWHLPDGRSLAVVAEQRPDGGVTYLYDDATERLALESRYNALFHVQRETLENLKEGVAVFATDGRLTLFNPGFVSIWKLEKEDLEQQPHIDEVIESCLAMYDNEKMWNGVKSAVTAFDEQRQPVEGQLERADDSVIAYACQPLPDGATLLTFVDITDTKRIERVLTERNEALEVADRMKNDFIQNVSYELRTPLTNIIGFSELLEMPQIGSLNDRQKEYLGDISSSSAVLLTIIDNILDLATIDAGALELKLAEAKVEDVVKAAALGVRDRLVRAKLGLDIRVDRNAKTILADENRVTQVLYNLLSNAIGFAPEGSRISLECKSSDGMVHFTVKDQGCGIGEEFQGAVFERFESRSQGSKHRGAGLGLSIVKSLVELHGGDISLKSKPGEGTEVIVRFPTVSSGSDPYLSKEGKDGEKGKDDEKGEMEPARKTLSA